MCRWRLAEIRRRDPFAAELGARNAFCVPELVLTDIAEQASVPMRRRYFDERIHHAAEKRGSNAVKRLVSGALLRASVAFSRHSRCGICRP
jgi:hypothetical protein